MAKLLYANFLDNKKVYNLAQAHWSKLLNSILKEHAYTFNPYINQIQNGQKEYDGNPIFSAYIPQIERAIVSYKYLQKKKAMIFLLGQTVLNSLVKARTQKN